MIWIALLCLLLAVLGVVRYVRGHAPGALQNRFLLGLGFLFFKACINIGVLYERLGWSRVAFMRRLGSKAPRDAQLDAEFETEDREFDSVKVRIFRPKSLKKENCPGIVFIHGGGWVMGNVDLYHIFTQLIAKDTQAVVVSVEYRMAPEHPFPAPFEDCVSATKHFLRNAQSFGVDPARVAVMGDSAGGNLTAAVCLKLRDEDVSPPPKAQVLLYPATQMLDLDLPSWQQNSNGQILSKGYMIWFHLLHILGDRAQKEHFSAMDTNTHVAPDVREQLFKKYVNAEDLPSRFLDDRYRKPNLTSGNNHVWDDIKEAAMNPYCSPLMADDFSNLPPAYVLTAQHDLLRDEGILFAQRLLAAGNHVQHEHSVNGFHGLIMTVLLPIEPEAARYYGSFISFLKCHLR